MSDHAVGALEVIHQALAAYSEATIAHPSEADTHAERTSTPRSVLPTGCATLSKNDQRGSARSPDTRLDGLTHTVRADQCFDVALATLWAVPWRQALRGQFRSAQRQIGVS
ncbi:MAG: hypothetical protein ACRDR6_11580 [Pseudonocardiaceae bacterium]